MSSDSSYLKRGASASKSEVHQAIKNVDKGLFPDAFCKITEDYLGNDPNFCNIIHADGAGTKASLAYLYYQETGDISVFKGIAQDSLVMNLDDLVCIGAKDNFIFSNTIGRNKHLISGEIIKTIIEGYDEYIEKLRGFGINIHSCGGETADVGDLVKTLIIDSTLCVRMKRDEVISLDKIKPGNVIVGLASFGKTTYEDEYNSGIGSNGLTNARHDVLSSIYKEKYPETYANETDKDYIYCGNYKLTDQLANTDLTIGKALLSPTRSFAPLLKKIFDQQSLAKEIRGIIHNTGGGQTKCKNFSNSLHFIKDDLFETPPIFKIIQESAKMSFEEMNQVFNMGNRMEIYLPNKYASEIIALAKEFKIDAKVVGYVEANDNQKNKVTILAKNAPYQKAVYE